MDETFSKILQGYQEFRDKYALGDRSIMHSLSRDGQQPKIMVIACCDSRVDPALILQCDPGDLFVVRNVANIVPPFEKDSAHHGTSAALEFAVCFLKVKHLILLGHSQCGGIQSLLSSQDNNAPKNDFITSWVSLIKTEQLNMNTPIDDCAKEALKLSRENCMSFPWIEEKIIQKELNLYLWFFDIKTGQIFNYSDTTKNYEALDLQPKII